MAELASGAVGQLLGVISHEALRLGRVRHDVQFIQEEMESMGSFLANLSGKSREHDEQVRTWMNQHRAAGQLRELKDRAQDIGNRRMRYGVEVKTESSSSGAGQLTEPLLLSGTQDHEEEEEDEEEEDDDQHGDGPLKVALSRTSMSMDKEDYFRRRLDDWIGSVVEAEAEATKKGIQLNAEPAASSKPLLPSIAFVVKEDDDADHLLRKISAVVEDHFKRAKGVQDKVVPPETKGADALTHEDKAVPPEIKDASALANENKAVPLETKDADTLVHEDKAVVPPETKDAGTIRTKISRRPRTRVLLCMKMRRLCHWRPRRPPVPSENKDAGALTNKDKPVPPETKDAVGAVVHEDKADLPAEIKEAGGAIAHKDNTTVPTETKDAGGALAHKDTPMETKDAGNVVVFVDVPAVHYNNVSLRPLKILCYILAELELQQGVVFNRRTRWGNDKYTRKKIREIEDKITEVGVEEKINGIVISNLGDGKDQLWDLQNILDSLHLQEKIEIGSEELGRLLQLLIYHSTSTAAASEKDKKIKSGVAELYDDIIKQTTRNLKQKMEEGGSSSKLQESDYEDILKTVFPETNTSTSTTTTAANSPHSTLVDDQIQEMVRRVTEMIHDLRELDKSDKTTLEDDFHQAIEKKKEEIIKQIRKQLKVKMMVQNIKKRLEGDQRILVILKVHDKHVPVWQETRNSLISLELECPIAGAVFVVTKTTQHDFPCPSQMDRIEYSLVGLYLDNVVQNTGQHLNFVDTRRILRNILRECDPHEFCMKIFAHALYTKPKRSSEELSMLHRSLSARDTPKSLPSMMFKFSYRELPKDYRSCLLYLAIFPQGEPIRRSTLIGRWVAEGLITTKDWSWSSSVVQAEKCFDTLVARFLVCPDVIGSTGKVKSCTVHKLVYGFITKIAEKQRILQTRLSRHLAHHFSIFSDVRLRSSETIEDFLRKSSQFSKLKVLDLEACLCFQHQCYLRDICKKRLMLKYLSLRGTDVTRLPSEINNLHELEVLDIRDTMIPAYETRNVLLLKLKRLLAGQKLKRVLAGDVDSNPSSPTDVPSVQMPETIIIMERVEVPCNVKPKNRLKRLLPGHVDSSHADFSSVQIPEKVEKMEGLEVLSNVKPKNHQDLKDIGGLNELKKLSVVINKESELRPLLESINDLLKQSLRFLSITLDITIYKGPAAERSLKNKPKDLESLTINGSKKFPEDIKSTSTQMGMLLESLTKNGNQLAKVTLSCTFLSQEHLKVLARLENLRCVKLRHNACNKGKLTFNKGEFKNLNKFLVEGNNMTEITFDNEAASNLEKIVLSRTNIVSISGVSCLQKLEELELNNIKNKGVLHSLLVNAKHITRVTLRDTLLEQGDVEILARKQKMRYLALLGKFYNGSHLIFKDEFQNLNLLIVDSSNITEISFTNNSSPNLEKIVWSFKEIVSLCGIDKLTALKELELNGDSVPNKVEEDIKKLKNNLDYKVQTQG
ncbi:unnamed protein product [Alopecurus aequalis]